MGRQIDTDSTRHWTHQTPFFYDLSLLGQADPWLKLLFVWLRLGWGVGTVRSA